jgi:hypothetical protein
MKARHDNFFRRLPLLDPDVGVALLQQSGIPRVAYLARVHPPRVILPFLQSFDRRVVAAWSALVGVDNPDTTTRQIAALSPTQGGLGFTCWATRCEHSYAASMESSIVVDGHVISNVKEGDRALAADTKAREELEHLPGLTEHLAATKGTVMKLRDTTTAIHFPHVGVQAFVRWMLRIGHPQLPPRVACPGCNIALERVTFADHVVGCARCHGYNASSRHAAMKLLLHEIFRTLGIQFDAQEPREFNSYTCLACDTILTGDAIDSHQRTCTKRSTSSVFVPDRHGPDGRVYLPQSGSRRARKVVWDFTAVSTTCKTNTGKSLEQCWKTRTATKDKLYKEKVEAVADQEFIVIGGSSFGELSASTVQFVKDLVAASNASLSVQCVCRKLSVGMAFCSGHVVAEAERRVGVVHQSSPVQAPIKSTIGRKGTAGRAVHNDDELHGGAGGGSE